ncbi:MAG: hypothetical protein E7Z97_04840 [Propionibacteriaceae bacterium]|nr:hypothetical protein [Propionibacteriaceae bacterium]
MDDGSGLVSSLRESGPLGEPGLRASMIRSGSERRVSRISSRMFGSVPGPVGSSSGWEGCTRIGASEGDALCSGDSDCEGDDDGDAEDDWDGLAELGVIVTTGVETGRSELSFDVTTPMATPVVAMAPAVTAAAIFMRATRRALIAKPTA